MDLLVIIWSNSGRCFVVPLYRVANCKDLRIVRRASLIVSRCYHFFRDNNVVIYIYLYEKKPISDI